MIPLFGGFLLFCFAGYVTSNPLDSSARRFSVSDLYNISKSIQEANRCPGLIGSCLCPWKWVPDVDTNRIPRTIYKAQKLEESECESDPDMMCKSENKRFTVFYLTHNSLRPDVTELPVSMACVKRTPRTIENGEHAYSATRD